MNLADLDKMSELSPFELKDTLIKLASSHSERLMLNAGRGNPNFLATAPRRGFFELGLFAIGEAERSGAAMPEGIGGLPELEGIATRFETFAQAQKDAPGIAFLAAAIAYARNRLEFRDDEFLHELVEGVLGCNYPVPVRMLTHAEQIVGTYLRREMTGGHPLTGAIEPLRGRRRHRRNSLHLQLAAGKQAAGAGRQDRDRHADLHALYRDPATERLPAYGGGDRG